MHILQCLTLFLIKYLAYGFYLDYVIELIFKIGRFQEIIIALMAMEFLSWTQTALLLVGTQIILQYTHWYSVLRFFNDNLYCLFFLPK